MPTRHGWAALLAAACAFAVGRVFGLIELYVLGTGLLAAVLIALAIVQRPLPPIGVERITRPSMTLVGEPARVDLEITNLGQRYTPSVDLWEPVGEHGGAPMQVARLAPSESASAAYRVPTAHRGQLQTGPLHALRRDALGFCLRTTVLAGFDEVLVAPHHVLLPFPAVGSAGRLGQHLRMKAWGQTGTEFFSLREYVPGDDLRRINWKASARSTELLVRETTSEGVRRCTVLLDTFHAEYDDEGFERAVSAAASVATSAAAAGVATRMVADGIDLRGPEVATRTLQWLATVAPTPAPLDADSLGRGAGDGLGLLVVVTGSEQSPAVSAARSMAGPDESLIVVATQVPPAGGPFVVDATTLDRLSTTWNALVLGAGATGARA